MAREVTQVRVILLQRINDAQYFVRWQLLDSDGNALGESEGTLTTDPNLPPVPGTVATLTPEQAAAIQAQADVIEQVIYQARYA